MAKRFDDIKKKKSAEVKQLPLVVRAPQAAPTTASAPLSRNVEIKEQTSSAIAREVKPGFFVPSSSPQKSMTPIPPSSAVAARAAERTRNSEEYFSSLGSHSVHRDRPDIFSKKTPPPLARAVEPASSAYSHADHEEPKSRERLNIPLAEHPTRKRRLTSISFFIVALFVILAGTFYGMSYFAKAHVTITPRQEVVVISGTFGATRGQNNPARLGFETMNIREEASEEIPAEEERTVTERASGTVTISNAYSTAPQRLIKNTRFETPDGKIYRAKDSIVVPGMTTENGKIVPGTEEAVVVADEPGDKYNIGPTLFTIPGFKGDPRYEKFFAQSTNEIKGGFSGEKRFPSEAAITELRARLRAELTEKLTRSAHAQTPPGYILFPSAIRITLADDPGITVEGSRATVTENGIVSGIIFKRDDLFRHVLTEVLASFDGGEVDIPDIENLTFVLAESTLFEANSLSFSLSGSAHVIWKVDTEGLIATIAGKPKKEFNTALSSFGNIRRAEASISPFWLFDFPKDPARITAKIVVE